MTGEPDSEDSKVIDDDQVGFVNGEPFYGDFHYHNGYPMTGEYHTGNGEYIHRTSSSSINNQYPEKIGFIIHHNTTDDTHINVANTIYPTRTITKNTGTI